MCPAIHLGSVIEDRGDFIIRVRFPLVVYGLYGGRLIDKRFFDSRPPKSSPEKATDFREGSGLGGDPNFLRQSCRFESLPVIHGHLSQVNDVLSLQKSRQPEQF